MINKQITISLFCILLMSFGLWAQEEDKNFIIGKEYTVKSEILDQDRPILVYLPDGYEEKKDTYPVLYLLDGRGNFHHTTASVSFLARNGRIPEMIVIGIPNTDDRTRDLTPVTTTGQKQFPTAGGAENMLAFIEKELMPYVKEQYRTEKYKMLVGHSFGGLFVTHTFLHHPNIFNSYISISPSLWWDNQKMVKEQTDAFFEEQQALAGHLYMTMGNEGGSMLGGAWKLAALLEEKSPENFHWEFDLMEKETHGSVPQRSTYNGLEFIFKEWNLREQEDLIAAEGIEKYEQKIKELYGLEQKWDQPILMRMGNVLMQKERYDKAVSIFKKATIIAPKSEKVWHIYGESLAKTGQKEAAIESFNKVIEINPKNMQALISLKKLGAVVSDDIADIQLSDKELTRYAGTYNLEIGLIANMSVEDQQLWVSGNGIPKEALFPIDEHTFFLTSMGAKLIFELESNKAVGFKVESDNGNFKAVRK